MIWISTKIERVLLVRHPTDILPLNKLHKKSVNNLLTDHQNLYYYYGKNSL